MRGYWPPPIWVPAEQPAKKWIGRFGGLWIAGAGAVLFVYLLVVGALLLHNGADVTIALVVGSVTVAASFIYTMAYRLGPRDTVSLSRLLLAFGLGGLVAVTLGSTFDSLLTKAAPGVDGKTSVIVLFLAGISEELAKILAVVLISKGLSDKSMRNGLFLGGAVGLGFAAMEDLAYAYNFYSNPPPQLHLTHIGAALVLVPTRAVLTPLLHPLYTALFGAALFSASKNGRFRITGRVVIAYLGVALAHGLWDGGAGLLQEPALKRYLLLLAPIVVFVVYPGVIVGTGLIWIKVARRARWAFQLPVAWWLAPPPFGGPPLPPPGPPGQQVPVGAWPAPAWPQPHAQPQQSGPPAQQWPQPQLPPGPPPVPQWAPPARPGRHL
ncbi:PrsW family intramembrane metalloprotease [Frondihabitans australicus]|uniref:RsiW-degrading membrane proteinase PrsW (M82 family) n=1 Tax=Frondihabitans australicus TaxID=386892 RepID=A0A495ICJ6_9MICO|nr:PrsW family glutamic-type intramembrane protease [Frondihabitans australicus]RKR73662.1 RsiW-degrading membrane proteinase PrsW (M82 family) [Frondihabitans australicus]